MNAANRPLVPVPCQLENIPAELRAAKRWVAWLARWEGEKLNKRPGRIDRPGVGLTNWAEAGWVDFDTAAAAYNANRDVFGGVGYVMTKGPGVTGVDLDHCIDAGGVVAPWAAEIVAKLDSYTEVSPSGTGLRVFVAGELDDWQARRPDGVTIEVYGGRGGRFLTVTGARVPGAPKSVRAARAGVMDGLKTQYYTAPRVSATVEDLHLPEVLPEWMLPDTGELDLPAHARNFLSEGATGADHSRQLFAAAVALAQAGITREEVFGILANNEHALEIAERHWSGNADKALRYLWKHSALKGEARASDFKQLRLDDFDDIEPEQATGTASQAVDYSDDFEDLDANEQQQVAASARDLSPVKKARFAPESATQFLKHSAPNWIVKGVLPRAGLGVIYGASSSGKTFFTLDLVGAVARGVEWRGVQTKKGRVLYVVAEGAGGFRNRLQAYCEAHEVDPGQFDIGFLRQAPNLLTKDDIREFLKEVIAYGKVDLIVIDTYARAMAGGNENDAKDVGQAVAHCDVIHRKTGAMVLLVHHSGKDATKGARGSGALRAAADLEIEVVQTREYRAATVTKQKDGADGAEYQFKLAEIAIGMDEDDELITSCTVEHCATSMHPGERKTNPEGANEKLIYKYMEGILGGSIKRDELIENIFEMLDHDAAPGHKDRRKERVSRAIKSLARKNLLEDEGVMVVLK